MEGLSQAEGGEVHDVGNVDEFGEGFGAHFLHEMAAMGLDGAFGHAELGSDLFVEFADDDAGEDLFFAVAQGLEGGAEAVLLFVNDALFATAAKGDANGFEECLSFDGLGQKIDGSIFHGARAGCHVSMGRQENHRDGRDHLKE